MAGFTGQRFFGSGAIALPRTARRWALPRAARRQRRPWRYPGIDYLMLSKYRRCPESEGCPEFLRDRYKAAFRGGIPWLRLVHETQDSALFAMSADRWLRSGPPGDIRRRPSR